MRDQWYNFINGIPRDDFYDFYAVVTAMGEPLCGDVIYVLGEKVNLKKVVRRIRITVMGERFAVDYAKAYTFEELDSAILGLRTLRLRLGDFVEKKSVDKLISALEAMIRLDLWSTVTDRCERDEESGRIYHIIGCDCKLVAVSEEYKKSEV